MKHLGDITKIDGHNVPLVDIVTGGSPCQDLSVAGKRAGLEGERSGLFMEQIRVVKEMRDESIKQLQLRGADVDIRFIKPRFMVWENVPGAFSSNHGEDFRCVLEEICRIADKTANVPISKGGRWSTSGCIMGNGWSVAWRLHDAQFWGVPQRRKRIALVADFGGESAPEILFERKSMSRDVKQVTKTRKGTSGNASTSFKEQNISMILFEPRSQDGVPRIHGDISPTLNTAQGGQRQPCVVIEKDGKCNAARRLTPRECERLQGFPDGWTDIGEWIDSKGKKHKDADSPRYKALGNSIALPFWQWMAERMTTVLKNDGIENPTIASLFDGISGFCLVYKRCGVEPIWFSEIEEFPIAVTKKHFGEE